MDESHSRRECPGSDYRFSALMDRMSGADANTIIQNYSDIMPGRPTAVEHRHPADDLREHYDAASADPLTKIHAATITAAENQTHDYYMTIGPMFADPMARQLYAEIASIEEQHVTQYGSLMDPKRRHWKSGCCTKRWKSTTRRAYGLNFPA